MASKIKVPSQKEEMLEKEGRETPLLDLSDAAVKELIRTAKKRGYVTHDKINALLSLEEVNSEQIESILAKFSEMGINVVVTEADSRKGITARYEPDVPANSEATGPRKRWWRRTCDSSSQSRRSTSTAACRSSI